MDKANWFFLIQDKKKNCKLPPQPVFIYDSALGMARLQVDRRYPTATILLQLDVTDKPKWGRQFVTLRCGKDKHYISVETDNYFFNTLMTAYREVNPERSCKEFVYDLVQARIFTMSPESHAFSIAEHWR
ncbi:MAG: hypothetical protein E7J78_26665 [Pantoea sp.]|nr:hypothetical protein [Pantoea sp.]